MELSASFIGDWFLIPLWVFWWCGVQACSFDVYVQLQLFSVSVSEPPKSVGSLNLHSGRGLFLCVCPTLTVLITFIQFFTIHWITVRTYTVTIYAATGLRIYGNTAVDGQLHPVMLLQMATYVQWCLSRATASEGSVDTDCTACTGSGPCTAVALGHGTVAG